MKRSILILSILIGVLLIALVAVPGRKVPQPDTTAPSAEEQRSIEQTLKQLPLYFIENQGQLDKQVAYYLQGAETTMYFTATGVTIAQTTPAKLPTDEERFAAHEPARVMAEPAANEAQRWSVKLEFMGANPDVQPVGEGQTEAVISYFKGQPEDWHTSLPTYSQVVYYDLWPGIDLVYEGSASQLKYTFIVQPGADPTQIRLAYRGATEVTLNSAGQMEVKTPIGGFMDDIPVAYQEINGQRQPVEIAYVLDTTTANDAWRSHTGKAAVGTETDTFRFQVGNYDPHLPLILDPVVLLYSGFIGGAGSDQGYGIAVDGSGNAYVTGYTTSTEATFPVLVGPDLTFNGGPADAFVAKVNSSGSALVYAGYIGGTGDDYGLGIAVDGSGNAFGIGITDSSEATFPVLVGPDLTYNGVYDAYVAKVNSSGSALDYAGYIRVVP